MTSSNRPSLPRPLARAAYDAAMRVHELQLWEKFSNNQAFAVRIDDETPPVLAQVLGAAGMEFGLGLYWGEGATAMLLSISRGESDYTPGAPVTIGSITASAVRAIPEYLREVLQASGRSDRIAPAFLVKPIGSRSRSARKAELRWMVKLLEVVEAAARAEVLAPDRFDPAARSLRLPVFALDAEQNPVVSWEIFDETGPQGLFDWPAEIASLPRRDVEWWLGRRTMPVSIADDDREVMALLIVEADTDKLLCGTTAFADELESALITVWKTMLDGSAQHEPGRPARLTVTDRALFEALQVPLAAADIEATHVAEHPGFDAIADRLGNHLRGDGHEDDDDFDDDPRNAPDELLAAIADTFAQHLDFDDHERSALGAAGREEYFGVAEPDYEEVRATAWMHWALIDGSPRTPALLELVRALPLDDRQANLLESLAAARPTIVRIVWRDESLDFTDLLEPDDDHHVLAQMPADEHAAALDGSLRFGRFYEFSGRFLFLPLGPDVPAALAGRALSFLREQGMSLDHDSLRRDAWLLGRLFEHLDELVGQPGSITTTDGDALEFLTATFAIERPDALHRALQARDDVHPADEDADPATVDAWMWFRAQPGSEMRTLLGRLQLLGDELLVEVHSRARLERIRDWLDQIPGVAYVQVRRREGPTPTDDMLPSADSLSLDAESLAAIQQGLEQRMLGWVDEKVPALGGLTPRQAVADPTLRKQVELLIRTMPDPGGIPGLAAPRDAIRKILGLDH